MKLSKNTLEIIKNYSQINQNLVIQPGNVLTVCNGGGKEDGKGVTIFAEANLEEDFPVEFGIYDINEFLGVLSLFKEPELDFQENFVLVKQDNFSVKYWRSATNLLSHVKKKINFPEVDIEFSLSSNQFGSLLKAASILSVQNVIFNGDGENITVQVSDKKNSTSNNFSIKLEESSQLFEAVFRVDNLKMLVDDYKVCFSRRMISKFESQNRNLQYYIGVEQESRF